MFIPGRPLKQCAMFESKARAYPSGAPPYNEEFLFKLKKYIFTFMREFFKNET
jgi:hypothetical protein